MSKRAATQDQPTGAVGKRQPCPCGSGKRYKACHGAAGGAENAIVTRPFEGLAMECELVALKEFVPSATASLPLRSDEGGASDEVSLATVLPMAAAALMRTDERAFVGLQTQTRSGDVSRDLARAVEWVRAASPGQSLPVVGPETAAPGEIPTRLQDLVDPEADLDVTLHTDFSWWMPEGTEATGDVALSLERANAAIMPTDRIQGVRAAYWVDAGEKAHVRWVRSEPEEKLLSTLDRKSVV